MILRIFVEKFKRSITLFVVLKEENSELKFIAKKANRYHVDIDFIEESKRLIDRFPKSEKKTKGRHRSFTAGERRSASLILSDLVDEQNDPIHAETRSSTYDDVQFFFLMIDLDFTIVEVMLFHQMFEFRGQQILMLIGNDLQTFFTFTNESIEMLNQSQRHAGDRSLSSFYLELSFASIGDLLRCLCRISFDFELLDGLSTVLLTEGKHRTQRVGWLGTYVSSLDRRN